MTVPSSVMFMRHGSSKDIYRVDEATIAFDFTDEFSAFEVSKASTRIPGKGKALCRAAVKSALIARAIGVPTCFIEQMSETAVRVREVDVFTNRPLSTDDRNCLIPLEFITRHLVGGSAERDLHSGKKHPQDFGFSSGVFPVEGTPFPFPIHEVTTKFEDRDRPLWQEEALRLGALSIDEYHQCWSLIDRLDGALSLAFKLAGFVRWDGKKEIAKGVTKNEKLIADVFGTQDEDRPVRVEKGKFAHYGKEYVLQYLIEIGYYGHLLKLRAEGYQDEPIPVLPEEVVYEASRRYTTFAERYDMVPLSVF